jgi:predicted GNAT family N-acyltransferase
MLKSQNSMKSNLLSFNVSQMIKYAQMYKESRDQIDWIKIINLDGLSAPTYIQVIDDVDNKNEVAYAVWGWEQNDNELRFGKIEVKDESLQKNGVGTTIMQLVIVIAKFYNASRITGTIAGDKYLWHWYAKLGFTIHDQNKLLMEFSNS